MAERPEHEPKPLGDLLKTLVAGRGWSERLAIGRLREAWPAVVGVEVAAHSEPVRLSRGTLYVRADSGAWATELTLLGDSIAAKTDEWLGGAGTIRSLKVATANLDRDGASADDIG